MSHHMSHHSDSLDMTENNLHHTVQVDSSDHIRYQTILADNDTPQSQHHKEPHSCIHRPEHTEFQNG